MKRILLVIMVMFGLSSIVLAEEYEEGKNYIRIEPQATDSGDKIEVIEFFWYGCPHCNVFDPILTDWLKKKPANVDFKRVPAVFRSEWKVHARTYYALQVMGEGEKYHSKIFNEIHQRKEVLDGIGKRNRLDSLDTMAKFLSGLGVNKKEFMDAYNSFPVDGMVRKAIKQLAGYKINGVPAMAVNGKYVVTGKNAGSYDNMVSIVEYLVKKESAEKK